MKMSTFKSIINGFVNPDITMKGKTVLITGANKGIGLATAKDLARRDARVILACRDKEKAEMARDEILKYVPGSQVETVSLDLSSLSSVRQCADDVLNRENTLDVLINNAGAPISTEQYTVDGIEMQFGVNHVGHFLLTNMLLPLMQKSTPSRIVVVSSCAQECGKDIDWVNYKTEKKYDPIDAHAQSKLASALFAKELSNRLDGTGVTCNTVSPVAADTDFWNTIEDSYKDSNFLWRKVLSMGLGCAKRHFVKPVEEAAQTQIFCAVAPELENVTGESFYECKVAKESKHTKKMKTAKMDNTMKSLWQASEKWAELQY